MRELQSKSKIDFFCIGTPDIIGDAVGPIVGSLLTLVDFKQDVQIVGTVEEPVMRSTYDEMSKRLRPDAFVVAIDAVVGDTTKLFDYFEKSLQPGASVTTDMEFVGDACIMCYTGSSVVEIINCSPTDMLKLAYAVTTTIKEVMQG